jgi:hypothetical protein
MIRYPENITGANNVSGPAKGFGLGRFCQVHAVDCLVVTVEPYAVRIGGLNCIRSDWPGYIVVLAERI